MPTLAPGDVFERDASSCDGVRWNREGLMRAVLRRSDLHQHERADGRLASLAALGPLGDARIRTLTEPVKLRGPVRREGNGARSVPQLSRFPRT